jgi:DNA sulfur modification protein DndC
MPAIFAEVYPRELIDWIENDAGAFSEPDAKLLKELEAKHDIPAELIMKLLDVELSQVGASKRRGVLKQLESVLNLDWEEFEVVSGRHHELRKDSNLYAETLEALQEEYEATVGLNL